MEPIQRINGVDVAILGDPHLGKQFVHGVPLERRGEREQEQVADFMQSISDPGSAQVHVCMGDIFDKFVVSPELVLEVAGQYEAAAKLNADVTYVILRGNHDAARDADRRSSFDLLQKILQPVPNVLVLSEPERLIKDGAILGFCPWTPFTKAANIVEQLPNQTYYHAIFGHWDMDDFGDENPNLIPVNRLKERTSLVYTGHVHTSETRTYGPLTVHVTGSMQPYTHAEDPIGERYVTLTPDEAAKRDDLRNKCVRIKLAPGEDVPDIDCLQLSIKRMSDEEEAEPEDISIEQQSFDFGKLFREALEAEGVNSDVVAEVGEIYEENREHD